MESSAIFAAIPLAYSFTIFLALLAGISVRRNGIKYL
jgi:hypothetical protein